MSNKSQFSDVTSKMCGDVYTEMEKNLIESVPSFCFCAVFLA